MHRCANRHRACQATVNCLPSPSVSTLCNRRAFVKITDIEISTHCIDLDPPFNASWDTRPRRNFTATITRVHTDEGITGIASGDEMLGFERFKDLFIGYDPHDIERHARIIDNLSFHYSRYWPLDLALWDLIGKIAN